MVFWWISCIHGTIVIIEISSIIVIQEFLLLHSPTWQGTCYTSYLFNITEYISIHFISLLTTACYNSEYDRWNCHCYRIFCYNIWSREVACGTIWGCVTNKNYYHFNVVCILIVPHWGTNQGCSINRGNTVVISVLKLYTLYNIFCSEVMMIMLYSLFI